MADSVVFSYYSTRGTILYTPATAAALRTQLRRLPSPPCRPRQRRPHSIRITRLPAGFVPLDLRPQLPTPEPKKPSCFRIVRKLASRENAKRVFGIIWSPFSSNSSTASSSAASSTRSSSPDTDRSLRAPLPVASADQRSLYARRLQLEEASGMSGRPSVDEGAAGGGDANHAPMMPATMMNECGKPICAGNGVACFIQLAEPIIFLTGLDHDGTTRDSPSNSTGLLRGKLQIIITKSAKIKAVTLRFTGRARTDWPEGIPPEKTQTVEDTSLRTQVLPFFNALYEGSESGYGTHCNYSFRDKSTTSSVTNLSNSTSDIPALSPASQSAFTLPTLANRSNRASTLPAKDQKRLSLQSIQSHSLQKGDYAFGPTPQQKGYKVFHPGVYEYHFELPIDNNSPESVKLPLAQVIWMLEVVVERAGAFKPDLQGFKEIPVIRTPSEDSLELVEPISIARGWEDQLRYEIMIAGKSFPLGTKIPIAFKLTPLDKDVQVHKIKVQVTETVEYFTNNKRVTRKDPGKKLVLLEKVAGKALSKEFIGSDVRVLAGGELNPDDRVQARRDATRRRDYEAAQAGVEPQPLAAPIENLLGDIDLGLEQFWGQTEIEMNAQLPTCEMMEKDRTKRLVPDCTWKCVSVHHWIKIVMRISRQDHQSAKRRHFEISIDSPFTILSCRATQSNLALPAYGLSTPSLEQHRVCGCPNAAHTDEFANSVTSNIPTANTGPENALPDLARPPQAHLSTGANVQRPIHLLRSPSYNPPAFDDDLPPPPMPTPPPLYDAVIGTPSHDGLADYFERLSQYDEDQNDEDDVDRPSTRGRVNVPHPRTPGGRVARSMDINREFMFNSEVTRNILGVGPS